MQNPMDFAAMSREIKIFGRRNLKLKVAKKLSILSVTIRGVERSAFEIGALKEDLSGEISLSIGMEGIRGRLDNLGGDRSKMLNSQDLNQSGVNWELPKIWGVGGRRFR